MKDIKFKDKIAQGINDLFYIWKREFQTTFRDQGVLIFFILVPLGYPLLYSFIYDNEVVREVPAVVVDDSHSSLSREYLHTGHSDCCLLCRYGRSQANAEEPACIRHHLYPI